jgi:hypothetical protein
MVPDTVTQFSRVRFPAIRCHTATLTPPAGPRIRSSGPRTQPGGEPVRDLRGAAGRRQLGGSPSRAEPPPSPERPRSDDPSGRACWRPSPGPLEAGQRQRELSCERLTPVVGQFAAEQIHQQPVREAAVAPTPVLPHHAYGAEAHLGIAADRLVAGGRRVNRDPVVTTLPE